MDLAKTSRDERLALQRVTEAFVERGVDMTSIAWPRSLLTMPNS